MMKPKIFTIICAIYCAIFIKLCSSQINCESNQDCSECIQHDPKCVWCIEQNTSAIHCRHIENINKCSSSHPTNVINPKSRRNILNTSGDQIQPSEIELQLRPGQALNFNFTYTEKKDYPVDMYFLMDVSNTMKPRRKELAKLASDLVEKVNSLTKNIRLGYGSFVDKRILPFVNIFPGEPYSTINKDYIEPYSFKNHLSLTTNVSKFSEVVNNTMSSGNIDTPEGGLEALMQAIVCKEEIGWRVNSRHLVILFTDETFHIAGDGKLAGIIDPNDCKCHLENNEYTHDRIHDYPSIGQVNVNAKRNNKIVIFAVTENVETLYRKLQHEIKNSHVALLSKDAISAVLSNIYRSITTTLKIQHNFSSNFNVKITSDCKNFDANQHSCKNIQVGEIIKLNAQIKLIKCPNTNKKYSETYTLSPSGLDAKITVKVKMLCDCPCEHNQEIMSAKCNKFGNLQCGICKCNHGKMGSNCQCDGNKISKRSINEDTCIKENSLLICSGQGTCKCGECICDKNRDPINIIDGKFCECNNLPCIKNGNICSGHGKCDCGICKCDSNWKGSKCNCPLSNDTCIPPDADKTICSGKEKGDCICGKCICKELNGHRYSGTYCEKCLTCPFERCQEFRHCVECKAYEQGIYDKITCEEKCNSFNWSSVERVETSNNYCSFRDSRGCLFSFRYFNDEDNEVRIEVQKYLECTFFAKPSAIMLTSISTIVVAALIALFFWKLLQEYRYRQEYAKFVKEQTNTKFSPGSNPLYRNPNSDFQNPTYNRKSIFR